MKGWARRKITYNLGKGGIPAGRVRDGPTGDGSILANPIDTLNPPLGMAEEYSAIIDEGREYYIDEDYRELGEREGWLRYVGYVRDINSRVRHRFEHIT